MPLSDGCNAGVNFHLSLTLLLPPKARVRRRAQLTDPFLAKIPDGRRATFLRLEAADKFVVRVNGVEPTVSRAVWRSLPDEKAGPRPAGHSHRH